MSAPARGEVWLADLNPIRGHEQAGRRPVLGVSEDVFNQGPAGLVIVLPMTSKLRPIPTHVPLEPPAGGLQRTTAVLCEAIRSISTEGLLARWGRLRPTSMDAIEDRLRILLRL